MRYFWCELAIVSAFMITFAVEFNSLTIINIRTMVNYKDLGLVNTRDMFAKAIKGGEPETPLSCRSCPQSLLQ